jgi:hypothetical protein
MTESWLQIAAIGLANFGFIAWFRLSRLEERQRQIDKEVRDIQQSLWKYSLRRDKHD